jgi:glycosyltransferase 2 family protein
VQRATGTGASPGRRVVRALATLLFTALCVWYIVAKIDFAETGHVLAHSRVWLLVLALAILVGVLVPLSWRWQRLLAVRGIEERVPWLLRAYFVSYMAGQVFPTSFGGDAMRVFETSRRHRGHTGAIAGSVLLERGLGGVATLLLGAAGFALAIGRYDVGAYLWLEFLIALATVVLAVVLFSRRARRPLRRLEPLLARVRLARPLGALYRGLHAYRDHAGLVVALLVLTLAVQAVRILSIWLVGKAVGVDLSPLPYFVMGPMFFLVMLAPFTVNGLALREAFFVSFLGQVGVDSERAFATGFLYFLLSLALAVPGAVIWGREGLARLLRRGAPGADGGTPPGANPERPQGLSEP